jgi:hypothetical protein
MVGGGSLFFGCNPPIPPLNSDSLRTMRAGNIILTGLEGLDGDGRGVVP